MQTSAHLLAQVSPDAVSDTGHVQGYQSIAAQWALHERDMLPMSKYDTDMAKGADALEEHARDSYNRRFQSIDVAEVDR